MNISLPPTTSPSPQTKQKIVEMLQEVIARQSNLEMRGWFYLNRQVVHDRTVVGTADYTGYYYENHCEFLMTDSGEFFKYFPNVVSDPAVNLPKLMDLMEASNQARSTQLISPVLPGLYYSPFPEVTTLTATVKQGGSLGIWTVGAKVSAPSGGGRSQFVWEVRVHIPLDLVATGPELEDLVTLLVGKSNLTWPVGAARVLAYAQANPADYPVTPV